MYKEKFIWADKESVACIAQTSTVLTLTSFYESHSHCVLFTTDNNVENAIRTYNHASKNNVKVAVPIFTKLVMGKLYHVTFYAAFQSHRCKIVKTKVLKLVFVLECNMTVPVHTFVTLVFACVINFMNFRHII